MWFYCQIRSAGILPTQEEYNCTIVSADFVPGEEVTHFIFNYRIVTSYDPLALMREGKQTAKNLDRHSLGLECNYFKK
jgi:hypothetical protein